MKRTVIFLVAISFALMVGGCSKFKRKKAAKAEPVVEQSAPQKEAEPAPMPAKATTKKKRILCSSKKKYKKGTPCWHWKRGARKGKPGKKKSKKAKKAKAKKEEG